MKYRVAWIAGAVGLAAGAACGQGVPQRLGTAIEVSPVRIAPVVREANGSVQRIGDWVPYGDGGSTRQCDDLEMVFDAIRNTGDCGDGLYFFGTEFCNMFFTNDMELAPGTDPDAGLRRMDFAWYWTCGGFGTETCIVAAFTQDSAPCDANSFDYSGWLLDFGTLTCNPGAYYLANVDLGDAGDWTVPSGGAGSYSLTLAREVTTGGALVLATCAQPMLWGTGDARGDDDAPGRQGPLQFDDVDLDGVHDPDTECFDYTFPDECPSVLGAAAGFWQESCDPCDFADFNGDGIVDTQDFTAYFNAWVPRDPSADCDGSGEVDTQDVLCFLNAWNACR